MRRWVCAWTEVYTHLWAYAPVCGHACPDGKHASGPQMVNMPLAMGEWLRVMVHHQCYCVVATAKGACQPGHLHRRVSGVEAWTGQGYVCKQACAPALSANRRCRHRHPRTPSACSMRDCAPPPFRFATPLAVCIMAAARALCACGTDT